MACSHNVGSHVVAALVEDEAVAVVCPPLPRRHMVGGLVRILAGIATEAGVLRMLHWLLRLLLRCGRAVPGNATPCHQVCFCGASVEQDAEVCTRAQACEFGYQSMLQNHGLDEGLLNRSAAFQEVGQPRRSVSASPPSRQVLCRTNPRCVAASETTKDMGNADDTHLALAGPQHARTRKLRVPGKFEVQFKSLLPKWSPSCSCCPGQTPEPLERFLQRLALRNHQPG